jgi:hypothetical protein
MLKTITCTRCNKPRTVTEFYPGSYGATLCDNCLIDDQVAKHGYWQEDDAEWIFHEQERKAWENRADV